MSWPRIDREPVTLPSVSGVDEVLWDTLDQLCEVRPGEWTLIGGQMVLLHALEHDTNPPRVSTDLDILVNARIVSGAVAAFVVAIESLGFELSGIGPEGIAHRYQLELLPGHLTGEHDPASTSDSDHSARDLLSSPFEVDAFPVHDRDST